MHRFQSHSAPRRRATLPALLGAALLLAACAGTGKGPGSAPGAAEKDGSADSRAAAGEARIAPADSGKLTLGEAVDQLSDGVLKAPAGTAWKPQTARAREIQRNRPELSALVEDADWVVTLSAELEGPRPAGQKAGLRRLHERYAAGAPHAEIAAQVNTLLSDIEDENLRRELKKLANRSWERDRRAAANPRGSGKPAAPSLPAAPVPAVPAPDFGAGTPPAAEGDTLVTPDRYCAERRAQAARSFADARGAADAGARARFLNKSLEFLDDCLKKYPDSPEAEKARQNRARVEQDLGK